MKIRNIIFHHPRPLFPNSLSASGIRPIRMLEAFRSLGYHVDVVAGYSRERKLAVKTISENVRKGMVYDFVYSESSTMPTLLTDTHHLPIAPFLDFSFFAFCKRHNIPIGLFYRDIYWMFEEYGAGSARWKTACAKFFYRYDLHQYEKYLDKLYLPSMQMATYISVVDQRKARALPPGHDMTELQSSLPAAKSLSLLYVGGLGLHYQMHELFAAAEGLDNILITICTRSEEWERVRASYGNLPGNVVVVHASGYELLQLYQKADIALLFVKPQEYRAFASPLKLYEYIGHGKPIVASEGTLAGKFVAEHGIGWSIPYSIDSFKSLIASIFTDRDLLNQKRQAIEHLFHSHTWQARAKQVADDLRPKK